MQAIVVRLGLFFRMERDGHFFRMDARYTHNLISQTSLRSSVYSGYWQNWSLRDQRQAPERPLQTYVNRSFRIKNSTDTNHARFGL